MGKNEGAWIGGEKGFLAMKKIKSFFKDDKMTISFQTPNFPPKRNPETKVEQAIILLYFFFWNRSSLILDAPLVTVVDE